MQFYTAYTPPFFIDFFQAARYWLKSGRPVVSSPCFVFVWFFHQGIFSVRNTTQQHNNTSHRTQQVPKSIDFKIKSCRTVYCVEQKFLFKTMAVFIQKTNSSSRRTLRLKYFSVYQYKHGKTNSSSDEEFVSYCASERRINRTYFSVYFSVWKYCLSRIYTVELFV